MHTFRIDSDIENIDNITTNTKGIVYYGANKGVFPAWFKGGFSLFLSIVIFNKDYQIQLITKGTDVSFRTKTDNGIWGDWLQLSY